MKTCLSGDGLKIQISSRLCQTFIKITDKVMANEFKGDKPEAGRPFGLIQTTGNSDMM